MIHKLNLSFDFRSNGSAQPKREMLWLFPLNKPYKRKLLFWGGLQLGVSPRAGFPREGRMLQVCSWVSAARAAALWM